MLHFVILSVQGLTATVYAFLYVIVFMMKDHDREQSDSLESLNEQITTNIVLFVQIAVDSIMGFFVCYLILIFSRYNSWKTFNKDNQMDQDAMLRANVPNLVYM